tara:strand:- start:18621 stop:19466 length:846 start_codon:yes stop_codon:yes gene_type:complete
MNIRISRKFTQVGSQTISYLTAGEGAAILLVHGWPTSAYLWRNIIPSLAKNHLVIAIDLPGFGKSDKHLDHSYSFRYYASVISGLLENLKIDKLTIGVHDLGGPIGLLWAVQNKKRIERLLIFNTLVYPEFSFAVKLFGLSTVIPGIKQLLTSPSGIKKAIFFGVSQKEKLTSEIIQQYQEPFQDKNARKVLLKSVQKLSKKAFKEIEQKLPLFSIPILIIYGEKDKILPDVKKTMKRVQKELPQTQVISLPNCGHFIQEEAPEEISKYLLEFLKRTKDKV